MRRVRRLVWVGLLAASTIRSMPPATFAQSATPAPIPGTQNGNTPQSGQPLPTNLRNEAPVDGFARRDAETISLRLPGSPARELLLHGFFFNGDPVATNKLHLRQLALQVFEITSLAYSIGEWEFSVADSANIYGTGARSDTLNRTRTAVRNTPQSLPGAKGSLTAKPAPFFMSTSGYGLWLDTPADATFDFNTARVSDVLVTASSERLRVVLFTDRAFPKMLEAYTALRGPRAAPAYAAFGPFSGPEESTSSVAPAAKGSAEASAAGAPESGTASEISFSPENGLGNALTAALSAGMSGMAVWAPTLTAGSQPDGAALGRAVELEAFSPVMEPALATLAEKAEGPVPAINRRYTALHRSLFPYRYAAAQTAVKTGMPIMRALPLLYQDDGTARTATDEYLFGPDLLVAPVVNANTRRPVYLLPGDWIDLWTGTPSAGGRTVLVEAPIETLPVFARAGAVLPEVPEEEGSGGPAPKRLDDRRVYEVVDAGASGSANLTDFEGRTIERSGAKLTIGLPEKRNAPPAHITVRWRFGRVSSAAVDGKPVQLNGQGAGSSIEFTQGPAPASVTWR